MAALFRGTSGSKAWILLYSGKKYKGFMEVPRMQPKLIKLIRNAAAGCGYQQAVQRQGYQPVSIWAPLEKFSGEWGVSLNIKRENGSSISFFAFCLKLELNGTFH